MNRAAKGWLHEAKTEREIAGARTPGSVRVSRAGEGVPPSRTFCDARSRQDSAPGNTPACSPRRSLAGIGRRGTFVSAGRGDRHARRARSPEFTLHVPKKTPPRAKRDGVLETNSGDAAVTSAPSRSSEECGRRSGRDRPASSDDGLRDSPCSRCSRSCAACARRRRDWRGRS